MTEPVLTWTALGAALAAVGTASYASFRIGRLVGIQNGMTKTLDRIERNIGKIFGRLDSLPCGARGAQAEERDRRIERLESQSKE